MQITQILTIVFVVIVVCSVLGVIGILIGVLMTTNIPLTTGIVVVTSNL